MVQASQILHPLGKPGIQPLVMNITANQDTKMAMYYARFTGPSDTEALFFEGTFRKGNGDWLTVSVFERLVVRSDWLTHLLLTRHPFLQNPRIQCANIQNFDLCVVVS